MILLILENFQWIFFKTLEPNSVKHLVMLDIYIKEN
jgi:hypothetical protein